MLRKSLFRKDVVLKYYCSCTKVDFLYLICLMYDSGYATLAFFCLYKFHQLNPTGTFEGFVSLHPNIFDNCDMFS